MVQREEGKLEESQVTAMKAIDNLSKRYVFSPSLPPVY